MQVIVPMSGLGSRFVKAGYTTPKPLIEVDGLPIIEHVRNLFPLESNFIFICNEEHISTTDMKSVLLKIVPNAQIVTIPKHKIGPVFAVQQVYNLIDDEDEVIVNYCDFGTYWDYEDFLMHTRFRGADGAIPAYKGFHPHMLGSTNYAFMRDDEQWMLEIQEKKPFTDNRMDEYASNGTYYFKTGKILKQFFDKAVDSGDSLNGEYYVSVVFNKLVEAGLKVSIYEIQHMLQWGTPEDVVEYNSWSSYFTTMQDFLTRKPEVEVDNLILPMAGQGSRFIKEGYDLPKPLIEINAQPMVFNAIDSLPSTKNKKIAILGDHEDNFGVVRRLSEHYSEVDVLRINSLTDGQASTCKLLADDVPGNESIIIGACDTGIVWSESELQAEIDGGADAIVFAFKNHPHANKNPEHYGWIQAADRDVLGVKVKQPISDNPADDWGIVGVFYFAKASIYTDAYQKMVEASDVVNGEYYVDTLINYLDRENLKVRVMPVDFFLCWGTPDDYKTFKYWQSYFHKSKTHPYSISIDRSISKEHKVGLINEYTQFQQEFR